MRTVFHEQLQHLTDQVAHMCGLAAEAMERATEALLGLDLRMAEEVISQDADIDTLRTNCEQLAYSLLALQAPVAGDLRTIVALIHTAEKIERMGDLARHVAEQTRRRHPRPAIPDDTRDRFEQMGRLAVHIAREVQQLITEPGQTRYTELNDADDLVDTLQQDLLSSVNDTTWDHGVRAGIDVALLARYYERFADQAVSITRRLDYIATGSMPEA